jgi:hypothetical protein
MLAAGLAQAASFHPLTEQERANLGATHVATFTYADFTETTTNTAQTFTNVFAVAAKEGVELVAMQLATAFDTGNTNYTGSVLVEVGDGADADLYLTSTELASDGTEVFLKFGRSVQAATSVISTNVTGLTLQTVTLDGTNATALVVTNVVATTEAQTRLSALTDDSTGRKVYTADDKIEFVFTPNAEEALSANTSGEVKFYFKVIK